MSNVLDQAQNVQGVVAAARKRDSWARQEANSTDETKRRTYREAIFDLEERFPDLGDVPVGGAEAFARQRGHGKKSRSPVHGGRQRRAPSSKSKTASSRGSKTAGPGRKPVPGIDPTARRAAAPRSAPRPQPTPRVDRAIRRTGIPATVDSGGSTVMAFLGATVGLGLTYLVVSSAEQKGSGMRAFPSLVSGVNRAVARFLGDGDVFPSNPGNVFPPKQTAGSAQTRQPARIKPRANGAHPNNR
jgi:hypothetical protein